MIKGPNPGMFNKHMSIYHYSNGVTEIGTKKTELVFDRKVWAQMRPTRGSEFLEYYRDTNMLQYKVTMRYIPWLTEKHVLVHNGKQYEINAIVNIMEADLMMEVLCSEMKDKVIPYASDV